MVGPCTQGDADPSTCPDGGFPFDFGIRLGLVFIIEAASMSLFSVLGLLLYIAYTTIKSNARRKWSAATHVHWYFLSLLVSEVIQAIGGIVNAKWVAEAQVTEGSVCTTQGVLKQCGDVGVALASLAIAVHTFCALVFRWRPKQSSPLPFIVLGTIWLFLILLVSLSLGTHRGDNYYGDTQLWCWITSDYPVQRIVLEYMWMWITCFINFVFYVPMALILASDRTVVRHGWRLHITSNNRHRHKSIRGEDRVLAIKMLVYPAVYTVTVLPIAITRWMGFTGHQVSWAGTVFSDVVFALSGFLNVVLFTVTRPNLLPQCNTTLSSRALSVSSPSTIGSHSRNPSENIDPSYLRGIINLVTPISPTDSNTPTSAPIHSVKPSEADSLSIHEISIPNHMDTEHKRMDNA